MDATRGPRIMVVDDDHNELDRTLEAIRKHGVGYEARIARGGFEALDYLFGRGRFHERRRHPLPDLVLLDFDMAPLDGLEVLRRMREAQYLPRIPVAILCKTEHERERALQAEGACACMMKPLSPAGFNDLLSLSGVGGYFLALPPIEAGQQFLRQVHPQPQQREKRLGRGEEDGEEGGGPALLAKHWRPVSGAV